MPRYKLLIEYDGTDYVGWQRQANGLSVQEVIETALKKLEPGPFGLRGAGRTDAGVHACAQVGHVDLQNVWRTDVLRDALNAHMRPEKVAILSAQAAPETFDARFSAKTRHYLYRIANRRAPLTFDHGRAWLVKRPLNAEAMHEAAQVLIGRHDFTTFRDSECQAENPVRTLDRLDVFRAPKDEIHICVSSRAFLHRQVRSMVGSLEHVGSGKWRRQDLAEALRARDRARCGQVAPAAGLYLVGVDY
ncbi:tRNA pseudouridine(38-40) synthase TruA [uncultured Rhodoblastus sp.]|uniref:tRNA pseudouridine(38-40) synthase TruA n=1 Tax=uncultured Rhodoblastus sp. TaxID=543037 RepID=UPI0025FFEE2B|nr:tRNA pseudouridine(38-40) synthase TruA [uncultured Rhodoblastus sp.]